MAGASLSTWDCINENALMESEGESHETPGCLGGQIIPQTHNLENVKSIFQALENSENPPVG